MTSYKIANIHFEDSYCEEVHSPQSQEGIEWNEAEECARWEDFQKIWDDYRREEYEQQEAEWAKQMEAMCRLEEEQAQMTSVEEEKMQVELLKHSFYAFTTIPVQNQMEDSAEEEPQQEAQQNPTTLANPAWDAMLARCEARRVVMRST